MIGEDELLKYRDGQFCYMLLCADGSLYTGYTTDVVSRIKVHNSGKGAKYTRSRRPCELVHVESFDTKEEAMSREYYIKHNMKRNEKMKLAGLI